MNYKKINSMIDSIEEIFVFICAFFIVVCLLEQVVVKNSIMLNDHFKSIIFMGSFLFYFLKLYIIIPLLSFMLYLKRNDYLKNKRVLNYKIVFFVFIGVALYYSYDNQLFNSEKINFNKYKNHLIEMTWNISDYEMDEINQRRTMFTRGAYVLDELIYEVESLYKEKINSVNECDFFYNFLNSLTKEQRDLEIKKLIPLSLITNKSPEHLLEIYEYDMCKVFFEDKLKNPLKTELDSLRNNDIEKLNKFKEIDEKNSFLIFLFSLLVSVCSYLINNNNKEEKKNAYNYFYFFLSVMIVIVIEKYLGFVSIEDSYAIATQGLLFNDNLINTLILCYSFFLIYRKEDDNFDMYLLIIIAASNIILLKNISLDGHTSIIKLNHATVAITFILFTLNKNYMKNDNLKIIIFSYLSSIIIKEIWGIYYDLMIAIFLVLYSLLSINIFFLGINKKLLYLKKQVDTKRIYLFIFSSLILYFSYGYIDLNISILLLMFLYLISLIYLVLIPFED